MICAYCDRGSSNGGRGGESGGEGGRDGDVILTMAREGGVPRRSGSGCGTKEGGKRIGGGGGTLEEKNLSLLCLKGFTITI